MFARGSSSFLEDLRILKNSLRSFRTQGKLFMFIFYLLFIIRFQPFSIGADFFSIE